jgi:hypothetical protein
VASVRTSTLHRIATSPGATAATAISSQAEFDVTLEYNNLRIRNAIVKQKNSDGENDARDLNDFRVILNYTDRW